MPKIGLRNLKTALAVFICLSIYFLIVLISNIFKSDWTSSIHLATKIYTPFFACIATVYSISNDKGKSIQQAKVRCIASIIGGLFGVLMVFLYTTLFRCDWPFQFISATGNITNGYPYDSFSSSFLISFILPIIIVSLSTIIVIWLCNLFKQNNASFISVLTLTAVMTSFGTDAIVYGFNRILSTIIGVLVALVINLFSIHITKNKNYLFVFSIDTLLERNEQKINGKIAYKINKLISNGANITFFSDKTPQELLNKLDNVNINQPLICLDGHYIFDSQKKEVLYSKSFDRRISSEIKNYLEENNINFFIHLIDDGNIYTYYLKISNDGERKYLTSKKNSIYECIVPNIAPLTDFSGFIIIEKNENITKICDYLNNKLIKDNAEVLIKNFELDSLYNIVYILPINANNIKDLCTIVNTKTDKVITIATKDDSYLLANSDYQIMLDHKQNSLHSISKILGKVSHRYYHKEKRGIHYENNNN